MMEPLSCIYLTRACPMRCKYCRIRDAINIGKQLSLPQWLDAFQILKDLGVVFHLVLGNEVLMLGKDFVELVKFWEKNSIRYAVYTTFPPKLWEKYKELLVDAGLRNISCGFDYYPFSSSHDRSKELGDIATKSIRGFEGVKWARKHGILDTQLTTTLSPINYNIVPSMIELVNKYGIWAAFNIIHYDRDGEFDFFPPKEEILELLPTSSRDRRNLRRMADVVKEMIVSGKHRIQNPPAFFDAFKEYGISLDWHCSLDSFMYTVDADGRMRACGYRRGKRSPQYSVFDLPKHLDSFLEDNRKDRKECPGCFWSYWYMAEYYEKKTEFRKEFFTDHASEFYIEGDKK